MRHSGIMTRALHGMRSATLRALVVTRPQGVKLLVGAEMKKHIRRRSFSAPCANALIEAKDWEWPSFQACKDAAFVCRSFETSLRRDVLYFQHRREVAALPPDEADALLDWCEETPKPRSMRVARRGFAETRQNWRGPQVLATDLLG